MFTTDRSKVFTPQETTGSLVESWTNTAMEILIAVGLVLLVVGTPFLFVVGTIYLNSLVGPEELPFLGQLYGP